MNLALFALKCSVPSPLKNDSEPLNEPSDSAAGAVVSKTSPDYISQCNFNDLYFIKLSSIQRSAVDILFENNNDKFSI